MIFFLYYCWSGYLNSILTIWSERWGSLSLTSSNADPFQIKWYQSVFTPKTCDLPPMICILSMPNPHKIHISPMAHYLFFPEMVVLCHESSLPCHFYPITLVAHPPAIYLFPFPFPRKFVSKNTKILKNPKKSFLTIFSTKCRFTFSYSVINPENDTECFCLTFILVKPISKWDRGSLYKFHPRKKWNTSSDLASFHARKRIWIGVPAV